MTIFELTLGGFTIAPSYYWLMYALWIFLWAFLLEKMRFWSKKELEDVILYVFFWIVLWGRLGYCFIYNPEYYITNPIDIAKIWEWGMSFHGWVIWTILAIYLYEKNKFLENIWKIALVAPVGIFFWRIWNYLNKELLGPEYTWFLAVELDWKTYFPSPLVEAVLEWILLFMILILAYKFKKNIREIGPLFLIFYSFFRFIAEFWRTPDPQIWTVILWMSMWQILSIIMLTIWLIILNKIRQ